VIIVMGVSGAGKTEVGVALAATLQWPFYDADQYHSPANVANMHRGEGLTDEDRAPWLARLHELVADVIATDRRCVLACSALKQAYREALTPEAASAGEVTFVYLDVPRDVLDERLRTRHGHFAPPELLDSQLATLEKPREALWVDGTLTPTEIVDFIRERLRV
jgi:gluconokinase